MTPWIQIYSNLPEHPKIYQLADTLETGNCEAVGVVVSLWLWAAKNAPDGDLSRFPVRALGDAVGWRGDTKRLYQSLVACGFIDEDGENTRLHDWEEYAVRLMEINERKKQQEYERIRRHRQRKKEREQLEQSQSKAEAAQVFPQDTEMTAEQEHEISAENPVEPENTAQYAEQNTETALCNAKGNVTRNVTCNVTKPKCNAPTGQDNTPQDKTEQYTTQPPPSGAEPPAGSAAAAETLIEEFRSRLGGMSPTARKELKSFLKTMEPEVCLRALDIGCDNGHPKWAYVRAILNRWRQSGVKVPGDLHGREAAPKQGNGAANIPDNATFTPSKPADGASCYSGVQGDPLGRRRLEAYLKGLREG